MVRSTRKCCYLPCLLGLILLTTPQLMHAQASTSAGKTPAVPDWAQPGSDTHEQVPPPADFHRP
ncbi:MAG TPA: biopolymer transporter Tol, partial [Acidobacteriaceae bacterium]|nr:biopolymer transporter Tol [Acidobacteriaceae bacterium]